MHSTQAQNQGGLVRHGLLVLPFAVVFLLFQILPMIWVIINSLYVEEEEVWGSTTTSRFLLIPSSCSPFRTPCGCRSGVLWWAS